MSNDTASPQNQPATNQRKQGRGPSGRFTRGSSGNPGGRKPGTRNHATRAAEALLEGEAESLTRKAVEMAYAGDTTALRLCLDRILPPRRGRPVAFALPEVSCAEGVTAALAAVLAAMGGGVLSPEEAGAVASVIELQRRAIDTVELEARLLAIERRIGTQ